MRTTHMPLVDRNEYIAQFAGTYGQLCQLVAAALNAGCPQQDVLEASRGNGNDREPGYMRMRQQRAKLNQLIELSRSIGITDRELIAQARISRTAVEQEFMRRIPRM